MIFFNNLLKHTVKWEIDPISKVDDVVKIGFYTFNYVDRDIGINRLIPLLTTEGPAFYKAKCRRGKFETTEFNNMYVIVDANVSVKLWVTYKVPKCVDVPCLNKLFIPYEYKVGRGECRQVAVTEQLINEQTGAILIRPADKYIQLSQKMIDYLTSKSVEVVIFNPTVSSVSLSTRTLKDTTPLKIEYTNVPFTVIGGNFSRGSSKETIKYQIDTTGFKYTSNNGQAFSLNQGTFNKVNVVIKLNIKSPTTPPSYNSRTINHFYTISGSDMEIVGIRGPRLDIEPGTVVEDYSWGSKIEGANNVSYIFDEIREYDTGQTSPGKELTIVAEIFTITYSNDLNS